MKKAALVTLCLISLCSVCLVMKTGTVNAYQAGYEVLDYVAITTPTMDGNWTTADEWTDADTKQLNGSLNALFRLKYVMAPDYSWINQYYLIEFFDDTTDNASDYIQICYAAATSLFGTPIGGTTPQTDCIRWDYVGHDATGLTVYRGNGQEWVETTDYSWPTDIEIVDTISASPLDSNPHWIFEIKIEHVSYNINPEFWIRIAAYDESNVTAGVLSWPPGSVDSPDDWGLMNAPGTTIPEGLTFGVMVLLTSVTVLIGSHYLRKRSKKREN